MANRTLTIPVHEMISDRVIEALKGHIERTGMQLTSIDGCTTHNQVVLILVVDRHLNVACFLESAGGIITRPTGSRDITALEEDEKRGGYHDA